MITNWHFGISDLGGVRVCARSTAPGQLFVTCAGKTFLGTNITASLIDINNTLSTDGWGVIDIDGLAKNKKYGFILGQNLVPEISNSLKTPPSSDSNVTILVLSCLARHRIINEKLMLSYSPDMVIYLGDTPYCDTGSKGIWGADFDNLVGVDSEPTMANWFGTHRQFMSVPALKKINTQCHVLRVCDDHEWSDNWDGTWEALWAGVFKDGDLMGVFGTTSYPATGAEISDAESVADDYWQKGLRAYKAYAKCNPKIVSADTDPIYSVVDYGPVRIFLLDTISYKSPIISADPGTLIENDVNAKTMLGLNQKNWLKTELAATPESQYIMIISAKEFFGVPGRLDGWRSYVTERDDIVDWIGNNLKNVFSWVGDMHYTHGVHRKSPFFLQANVAPGNYQSGTALNDGYFNNVVFKYTGHYHENILHSTFGIQKISESQGEMLLIDASNGKTLWNPIQKKSSNEVTYAETRISI